MNENKFPLEEVLLKILNNGINITINDANLERAEAKPNLLLKMCPACEANQVNVKHDEGKLHHTCPTCSYKWDERAIYNTKRREEVEEML